MCACLHQDVVDGSVLTVGGRLRKEVLALTRFEHTVYIHIYMYMYVRTGAG